LAGLLKIAGIPRSTYFHVLSRLNHGPKHEETRGTIHSICEQHKGRYGYRRVTLELHRQGQHVNHKLVMKLMHEEKLTCRIRAKKYRSYRGELGKIAPNLLARDFHADAPNQKWTTDVTQIQLFGQKLFLSPILDLYNSEIVSYDLSDQSAYRQVTRMLSGAFVKIPDGTNLILHSDQGWQYQMRTYQNTLQDKGVRQSMSRKGNCLDNSVMENFFGILKSELVYDRKFESLEDFRAQLVEYMDYYNHNRIKEKLNGMSPVEYRTHSIQTS
jgi:transposase InsO family protein